MLVSATFSIPTALTMLKQTDLGPSLRLDTIVLIVIGVAYLTISVLLFTCAKRFATFVTRGLDSPSIEISENSLADLQPVAFAILGAYVLAYAIPEAAKLVTFYIHARTEPETERRLPVEYLIEVGVQLGIGIWLLIGSRGIARLIGRGWNSIKAE